MDWSKGLTLKASITTAADDNFHNIFPKFQKIIRHDISRNRLPEDNSHEVSCLIIFEKGTKF